MVILIILISYPKDDCKKFKGSLVESNPVKLVPPGGRNCQLIFPIYVRPVLESTENVDRSNATGRDSHSAVLIRKIRFEQGPI
jgi:hypothetical protein